MRYTVSMWIALWLLIVVIVSGLFYWSTRILFRQKKAWKVYADKFRLLYQPGRFLNASSITGVLKGYRISVFSEPRLHTGRQTPRYMTCIQFSLPPGMPTGGIIASRTQEPLVRLVGLDLSVDVTDPDWDASVFIRTEDPVKLRAYLTPERIRILDTINKIKDGSLVFMFDTKQTYLRFETPLPLDHPAQLDQIVRTLLEGCSILSIEPKAITE